MNCPSGRGPRRFSLICGGIPFLLTDDIFFFHSRSFPDPFCNFFLSRKIDLPSSLFVRRGKSTRPKIYSPKKNKDVKMLMLYNLLFTFFFANAFPSVILFNLCKSYGKCFSFFCCCKETRFSRRKKKKNIFRLGVAICFCCSCLIF